MPPRVSVLMSVHNAERYVEESVRSILNQTCADFEFLIADDASTDATWARLLRCAKSDGRIRLFHNERKAGVATSVTMLFKESRGEYVARMDGDDVAHPARFEIQAGILDSDQADLCGSWVEVLGRGRGVLRRYPVTDEEIRALLLFVAPFAQPTVMMRRELLNKHPYRSGIPMLEDNDLWIRMAGDARMHNVPLPLLKYRVHSGQHSSRKMDERWTRAGELGLEYLQKAYGVVASPLEREIHIGVRHPRPPVRLSVVDETEAWLTKLNALFDNKPLAQRAIAEQWYRFAIKSASLGPGVYKRFKRSRLYAEGGFHAWQTLAVAGLSVLRVRYGSPLFRFLVAHSPAARAERPSRARSEAGPEGDTRGSQCVR